MPLQQKLARYRSVSVRRKISNAAHSRQSRLAGQAEAGANAAFDEISVPLAKSKEVCKGLRGVETWVITNSVQLLAVGRANAGYLGAASAARQPFLQSAFYHVLLRNAATAALLCSKPSIAR